MCKCLLCRLCGDLVPLKLSEVRTCSCGNVSGKYMPDGNTIAIKLRKPDYARIVGINNYFLFENLEAWKTMSEKNPEYDKESLFIKNNSHIVIITPFTTSDVVELKEGM